MKQYILRRVGYSLLSMFLLSLVIFLFVRVTGDPVSLLVEPGASPEDIENMRRQFGLDQPLWVQYWHFMASLAGPMGPGMHPMVRLMACPMGPPWDRPWHGHAFHGGLMGGHGMRYAPHGELKGRDG